MSALAHLGLQACPWGRSPSSRRVQAQPATCRVYTCDVSVGGCKHSQGMCEHVRDGRGCRERRSVQDSGGGCGGGVYIYLCPTSACTPCTQDLLPSLIPEGYRAAFAWVLAHYSQLCDILGDPLGQGLEVLVAAADNRVEAGAFLRALGPGDAAGLLLTCTRHGKPPSHQGPALGHCVRPDSMPCACLGWLPSHANHPLLPPKQAVAGKSSQELAAQELLLHPEIACPTGVDTTSSRLL